MKLKNKINIISDEIKSETPNIDYKYILKTAKIDNPSNYSLPSKPKLSFQKLILKTTFGLGLIFILSISLIIGLKDRSDVNIDDSPDYTPDFTIDQQISYSSISIVSIINNSADIFESPSVLSDQLLINEEIDFLNRHLHSIELYITSNNQYQRISSDNNSYENLIVFNNNSDKPYKIYFNEINEDEDISIMVNHNNKDYFIEGAKRIIDNQTNYEFNSYLDSTDNYVRVNASLNNDYTYTIVRENVVKSKSKITLFSEDNENHATLENTFNPERNLTFIITEDQDNISLFSITYQFIPTTNTVPEQNPNDENPSTGDNSNDEKDDLTESGSIDVSIPEDSDGNLYSYSITSDFNSYTITKDRNN